MNKIFILLHYKSITVGVELREMIQFTHSAKNTDIILKKNTVFIIFI